LTTPSPSSLLRFSSFEVNLEAGEVRRLGFRIKLQEKPFQILMALLERPGGLVTRDELHQRLWFDNTFVDFDHNLNNAINKLREALNDSSEKPRFIETIPRRGYRFIGTLEVPGNGHAKSSRPLPIEPDICLPDEETAPPVAESPIAARRKDAVSASRLVILTAAVLLCALISWIALRGFPPRDSTRTLAAGPASIAVLPFVNLTGSDRQEYICDGLTESMISELSRLSPERLSVIARTSVMHYKNSAEAIPQIARELGVNYILESSLRSSDNRLHVTSQLIRGADAMHIWTGEYERDLKDVLDVQQQVAMAIAGEIKLNIPAATTARLHQERPVSSEAYQNYLLGRFHWNKRNREGLSDSVKYFERAIQQDPGFARAYAGLSDAYLLLGGGYMPAKEAYDRARQSALKALELDDTLAEARVSLAYEEFIHERDWAGSEENYRLALRSDPNYATGHLWYAMYLAAFLRTDEALGESQLAITLDPLSLSANYNRGWILICAKRYDEAILQLQKALEIDPNSAPAYGMLALAFEEKGDYEQAREEFQKAQGMRGEYSPYAIEIARTYALEGLATKAESALRPLLSDPGWQRVAPYSFAVTYAAMGKKDEAFRWLSMCVDDHSCGVSELNTDHGLDPLRSDPRFAEIRSFLKLPN